MIVVGEFAEGRVKAEAALDGTPAKVHAMPKCWACRSVRERERAFSHCPTLRLILNSRSRKSCTGSSLGRFINQSRQSLCLTTQ